MNVKIKFAYDEVDLLIQIINKFMIDVNITNFPLKNKLLLNETSFYENEVEFLYLYLKCFKSTIEKYLDNPDTNDENLRLNYKGVNHCLRKCRLALEENGVDVAKLKISLDEFLKDRNFI